MNILTTIEQKLRSAFNPTSLDVRDDSGLHYGHDGAREGHVSHVSIKIAAPCFAGKTMLKRHREVLAAIAPEVAQIHAITQLKVDA